MVRADGTIAAAAQPAGAMHAAGRDGWPFHPVRCNAREGCVRGPAMGIRCTATDGLKPACSVVAESLMRRLVAAVALPRGMRV